MDPIEFSCPTMGDAEADAVREVINSGWIVGGKRLADFEAQFAAVCGGTRRCLVAPLDPESHAANPTSIGVAIDRNTACVAPFVCDPSVVCRWGSTVDSGIAGPQFTVDDPELYGGRYGAFARSL